MGIDFQDTSAVWLVGCWPPQRYAVITGVARIPRGQLMLRTRGLEVAVSFRDFAINFTDMRVDVQCHGGEFILAGMGAGKGRGPEMPGALYVAGQLDFGCSRQQGAWASSLAFIPCWLLSQYGHQIVTSVMNRGSVIVASF